MIRLQIERKEGRGEGNMALSKSDIKENVGVYQIIRPTIVHEMLSIVPRKFIAI